MSACVQPDSIAAGSYYAADVITAQDYYVFGSIMPNREYKNGTANDSNYVYAFNGKPKIDEVNGDGVDYDYGFRIYDSRIGRFLSVDPLAGSFAGLTPYQYASNTPVVAVDLDGLESVVTTVTHVTTIEHQAHSKDLIITHTDVITSTKPYGPNAVGPQKAGEKVIYQNQTVNIYDKEKKVKGRYGQTITTTYQVAVPETPVTFAYGWHPQPQQGEQNNTWVFIYGGNDDDFEAGVAPAAAGVKKSDKVFSIDLGDHSATSDGILALETAAGMPGFKAKPEGESLLDAFADYFKKEDDKDKSIKNSKYNAASESLLGIKEGSTVHPSNFAPNKNIKVVGPHTWENTPKPTKDTTGPLY